MADGHGGHRTPEHPAPASGPGRLSKRTDGQPGQKLRGMTGQSYGAGQELTQQESAAPMSLQQAPQVAAPDVTQASAAAQSAPTAPFGRPTDLPGQPITHGAPIGPGPGPSAMPATGLNAPPDGYVTRTLKALSARDATGVLASLLDSASMRGV